MVAGSFGGVTECLATIGLARMRKSAKSVTSIEMPQTISQNWQRLYREFPDVYDVFAKYQDAERNVFRAVTSVTGGLAGLAVLDIGTGTGKYAMQFSEVAEHVWAVEPCEALLAVAVRNAMGRPDLHKKITFASGTAQETGLRDNSVDVAFAGHSLTAIESRDVLSGRGTSPADIERRFAERLRAVRELERVTRPGGWIFSLTAAPRHYGGGLNDIVLGQHGEEWATGKERFLKWMEGLGFESQHVDARWRFPDPAEAAGSYGFIYGVDAIEHILAKGIVEIPNPVVLQFRRVLGEYPT